MEGPSVTVAAGSPAPTQDISSGTGANEPLGSSEAPVPASIGQAKTKPTPEEMYEIKANGKTVRLTAKERDAYASMGLGANEKFVEAKRDRAEVERIINTAKSNPIEALMDPKLGLSKDQIRDAFEKWYTKEYIEPEGLTPEQLKYKQAQEELERYKEEEKSRKNQQEKEHFEKLTQHELGYLQNQIIEALDNSNLPKTRETIKKMAFYMRQNLINGWDAPMDLIIKQVKDERDSYFKDEIQSASVEQAIELLGEDFINRLRRYDLEQLRKKRQIPAFETQNPSQNKEQRSQGRLYSKDVNQRLRDIRLGKL